MFLLEEYFKGVFFADFINDRPQICRCYCYTIIFITWIYYKYLKIMSPEICILLNHLPVSLDTSVIGQNGS